MLFCDWLCCLFLTVKRVLFIKIAAQLSHQIIIIGGEVLPFQLVFIFHLHFLNSWLLAMLHLKELGVTFHHSVSLIFLLGM